MWGLLAIIAAVLLGVYDVFKKISLNNNAVLPVLFFSVLTSALLFSPVIIGSALLPEYFQSIGLFCKTLSLHEHLLILLKAIIVVSSWVLAFFAVKHLPLSIVSPIRASAPVWTLLGALIIFSERLNSMQWTGLSITLIFFFLFSTTGKLEGIVFTKNKWIFFIIAATLLGSISALYDKFIINAIDRIAVQSWFSVYQVTIMGPVVALFWWPNRKKHTPFEWRWSIPFIGIFLIMTDFFYFYAISYPGALISVISGIRRSGAVIAFLFAALLFKEKNISKKALFLMGIITGVILMALGSH